VKRLYTNMPKEYPVGGYKEIGATPWHKRVVEERRAWVGHNATTSSGPISTTS